MADIDLVVGEYGFNYDFTIFDGDGVMDISGFDTITLDMRPGNFTDALILTAEALAFVTDGTDGGVRWTVGLTDVPTEIGPAYAQITLDTSGASALRRTKLMTVMIHRDIT